MNTITTSKAQCRDCYKCIRYCPVKAIGLNDGQAWVDKDKCILCGRCIGACPQKAKSMASQLNQLERYLESGESIVFSIAPSYLAATSLVSPWKLIAALKKLGPVSIEETALGAELIAKEYGRVYQAGERKTVISSCCPVVVNLVEKYYPSLIPDLAGLVSPMVAHCRAIKKKCGQNKKVIFLGPCLAKKAEPNWESPENSIDAVLTFEELVPWLRQKGIEPENLSDEFPDYASNQASIFPLKQGILKTAGIQDGLDSNIISISGIEECLDAFNDLEKGLIAPKFIEALACKGGCIGGPAIGNDLGIQARRQRLFYFSQTPRLQGESLKADNKGIWRTHSPILKKVLMPSESEIREVLKLTGKNG
ncbi:MAG TPA: histidine kinase, partial [Firmicutes bacterium]|nr:histidine kinase [Bacillota bacterium]